MLVPGIFDLGAIDQEVWETKAPPVGSRGEAAVGGLRTESPRS